MANPPGYPPQMQQPMQQQPMQQPQPMGQMPPQQQAAPKPVKRGTSKIVPVVVSAGLAVGTFCGLLFGVGTGEVADASPSSSDTTKDEKKDDTTPNPSASAKPTETKPAETKPAETKPAATVATTAPAAGSAAPAAGSATTPAATTTPAAGSAATPAAATTTTAAAGSAATTPPAGGTTAAAKPTVAAVEPAVKKPKLTVEVTPASVAATAKITVDGKALEGNALEIDLGKDAKKEVKIVVKASGYKTVEQKVDIDSDVAVKIELIKRPSAPAGGTTRPTGTGTKPKKPPGGLIDI